MAEDDSSSCDRFDSEKPEKMFSLKKWNAVAMWSWDVECDTCAICRVQVMGESLLLSLSLYLLTFWGSREELKHGGREQS